MVPVAILELSDRDARRIALAENLQREGLNVFEQTVAILNLIVAELNLGSIEEAKQLVIECHLALRHPDKKRPLDVDPKTGQRCPVSELETTDAGSEAVKQSMLDCHQVVASIIFDNCQMAINSFYRHRLKLLDLPSDVVDAVMNGLEYTKAIAISRVSNSEQREDLIKSALAGFSLVEIKKQVKILLSFLASEVEQPSEDKVAATQEALTNESAISDRLPDRQQRVTSFLQKA